MATKKNQQVDPAEQFVHQIRQILDQSGQLNEQGLDTLGKKNNDPIMNLLLHQGYSKGMDWFESDAQAKDSAIRSLRAGEDPFDTSHHQHLGEGKAVPKYKHNTASENLADALYSNALKAGLSPELATQAVKKELDNSKSALGTVLQAQNLGNSTLPGDIQQALLAKSAGAGAGGGSPMNPASMQDMINKTFGDQLNKYYNRGEGDILAYTQEADVMRKTIPTALQPLYATQESLRAGQMQDNLDMYRNHATAFPFIDQLKNAAKDYMKGPSSSNKNTFNTAISGLAGLSKGGLSGGFQPMHSGSAYSGMDFGRQILQLLNWSQSMGKGFQGFETGVNSASQISNLQNLMPKNKGEFKALPAALSILNG